MDGRGAAWRAVQSGLSGTCEGVASSARGGIAGFGAAMLGALWAYDGWQNVAPLAGDIEPGQAADQPFFQIVDITPDVGAARLQIEHDIADPLARSMIGELPAAPGPVDRKAAWIEQILVAGTGARGIERRMFAQPDQPGCGAVADCRHPRLHHRNRRLIGDQAVAYLPFQVHPVPPQGRCTGTLYRSWRGFISRKPDLPRRTQRHACGRRSDLLFPNHQSGVGLLCPLS